MPINIFCSLEEIFPSCSVNGLDCKTVICSEGNFAESRSGLESASLGNGEDESYKLIPFYRDPEANFRSVITETHTTTGKLDKPQ